MFLVLMNIKSIWGGEIIFFRGIKILTFTGMIVMWLVIKLKYQTRWSYITLERLGMAVIFAWAVNLVVFVLLPVTFDRSVSMYLLKELNNQETNSLEIKELIGKMESEYVEKGQAVQRRMDEQRLTGFVEHNGYAMKLSNTGQMFLKLASIVARLYGLDN